MDNEIVINEAIKHINGANQGFFVTVDSKYVQSINRPISSNIIMRFRDEELKNVCNSLNKYCYGRAFERNEKRLKIIAAIEIGKEEKRLHAHLVMLHPGDCDRTVDEVTQRLRKICNPELNMVGDSAIDVKEFDSSRRWMQYLLKSKFDMQSEYNDFECLEFY